METKHTPGTWIIDDSLAKEQNNRVFWYYIKTSEGDTIAEVKGLHCGIENNVATANTKLIATAPEGLQTAINTYIDILLKTRLDNSMRFAFNDTLCALRNYICEATGLEAEEVQTWAESQAIQKATS